ncbi:MAG TPA: fluoride efflux transporter CrcB [Anaerolineales bacterium]|nr:fluoride efflux transporter CrcB [Anaerolineales bacterium]
MTNILLVGIGGFIGSVMRYLLSGWVQQTTNRMDFPFGTLAVNVIGCFVIGLLAQFGEKYGMFSNESRAFIFIGLLGGFTTFSAFGNDTVNLVRQDFVMNAMANVGANVTLGILAVWLGHVLGHLIWR